MCGIAGSFSYREGAPPTQRDELARMSARMRARGPDGEGEWIAPDGRAGLVHRRLAIIDLSLSGAQPMHAATGRHHITFNGEIYNYRELRRELEAEGCRFSSTSDTEVLLHLFERRGAAMLKSLRGMYAFGIYDSVARTLFLARDAFGIKPLYYADDGACLRFASQVKALVASGAISMEPSPAGHVGFYLWGHVPEPHTQYRAIKALPAGCCMTIDAAGCHEQSLHFNLRAEFLNARHGGPDRLAAAHEALRDTVRHHLVADVPVGVFLSSGIDSSLLTALATAQGADHLRTLTLGFDEYRGTAADEAPLAQAVAATYATSHEIHRVSRDDFRQELPALLDAMDQPSIDGVNTYFVSRAAARAGMKVAMSGLGADELLGGYPSFSEVPAIKRRLNPWSRIPGLGRSFRAVSAPLLRHFTSPKYAGLVEYGGSYGGAYLLRRGLFMPWELPELLDADIVREGWRDLGTLARLEDTTRGLDSPFQAVSALELAWYMRNQLLRDSDWAGMAHSIEIRVPFVDVELFRSLAPYMASQPVSKLDAAAAAVPSLPAEVLRRPKTGFAIPVREWMQGIAPEASKTRGLRSWARKVGPPPARSIRVLALATDAFGAKGGIAKFNRDLFRAICSHPLCGRLVAVPRLAPATTDQTPPKLEYRTGADGSKVKYLVEVLRIAALRRRFDVVVCCHINLLPVAWLASVLSRAPLFLVIHGIDAWKPTRNPVTNTLARRIMAFAAVSGVTRDRFLRWTGLPADSGRVLPNSVDLDAFYPAARSAALVERHALAGKRVIMTMARLSAAERYKGIDEVIELMPALLRDEPDLAYLVVGDGDDRARLEAKVRELGLQQHVIFAGYVAEAEKRDYYNVADAFVMPGRGEGFGIVYIEALACGLPTVGSKADGSVDALKNGELGILVDPDDADDVKRGILLALHRPRSVSPALEEFTYPAFQRRVHRIIDQWSTA
jgi:asparagine synthase (glutamine-hydrolysing)